MTALQLVRRARRTLVLTVALTALLWGLAAALALICTAALLQLIAPLPAEVYAALWPLAAIAALVTAGLIVWRWRMARSVEHVALWIEEHEPELRFALVTAIDPISAPEDRYPVLHERARAADIGGIVGRAWKRALGRALMVAVPLVGLVTILKPQALLEEARSELARRMAEGPPAPLANRLEKLNAVVTPPAYTRLPATKLEEPNGVAALIGSRITFGGGGPADGVAAIIGKDTLAASEAGKKWQVSLTMPGTPVVASFHDREYSRLVVLEPRQDSVPAVKLRLPARDTTYRKVPAGQLVIEAELGDDIGLDYGYVEYMVTAGGGENFETKKFEGRRVAFNNARSARLREVIRLDTMRLAPGTVLHITAYAFDYNNVTGPGRGVSETRTLRIAEPEDSTSVTPIPPIPIDSMWISQRLLNMKTDTLLQNREKLERKVYTNTSSAYGGTQDEIRMRALAVISTLEDDGVGGTFQTEISKKLREAAALMYDARVHLGVGEPDRAMPIMIRILEILDEIRLANRYYLRGLIRPEAIDIAQVRLTGTDPAGDEPRVPRAALADSLATLAERIGRAVSLIDVAPEAARDSLFYIRAAALTTAPAVATALSEVIDRLQRGEPIGEAIARTRRMLEPPPQRIDGPVEWRGIP